MIQNASEGGLRKMISMAHRPEKWPNMFTNTKKNAKYDEKGSFFFFYCERNNIKVRLYQKWHIRCKVGQSWIKSKQKSLSKEIFFFGFDRQYSFVRI